MHTMALRVSGEEGIGSVAEAHDEEHAHSQFPKHPPQTGDDFGASSPPHALVVTHLCLMEIVLASGETVLVLECRIAREAITPGAIIEGFGTTVP
jgi:hypothetical protein